MADSEDKCPLCGEQMLSLACPGGCFTATAHEVDGLACKLRQLAKAKTKIDRLSRELAKARAALVRAERLAYEAYQPQVEAAQAACAAMRGCLSKLHFHMKYWGSQEDGVPEEMYNDWKAALELVNSPNPGQSLLNEIDRLRRLEAAVGDDSLMRLFYKDSGHADVTMLILRSYRAALLAAVGKD